MLYSLGIGDLVNCYHCGIGIRNWEFGDNPMELHIETSPNCYLFADIAQEVSWLVYCFFYSKFLFHYNIINFLG